VGFTAAGFTGSWPALAADLAAAAECADSGAGQ